MEEGGGIYVDLQGETDLNVAMMAMLQKLQQELAEIKSQNDRLSLASEEQERFIRELTSRNSQEGEGSGKRKTDESDEEDAIQHQNKQKKELQGEF